MKNIEKTRICGNCPIPDDDSAVLCESAANIANVEETTGIIQSTFQMIDTQDRIAIEQDYMDDLDVSPQNFELVKKCADKILSGTCEFHSLDSQ